MNYSYNIACVTGCNIPMMCKKSETIQTLVSTLSLYINRIQYSKQKTTFCFSTIGITCGSMSIGNLKKMQNVYSFSDIHYYVRPWLNETIGQLNVLTTITNFRHTVCSANSQYTYCAAKTFSIPYRLTEQSGREFMFCS